MNLYESAYGGPELLLDVFFAHSLPYSRRQVYQVNPELASIAVLASQITLGNHYFKC